MKRKKDDNKYDDTLERRLHKVVSTIALILLCIVGTTVYLNYRSAQTPAKQQRTPALTTE
jgi:hypothetical protein